MYLHCQSLSLLAFEGLLKPIKISFTNFCLVLTSVIGLPWTFFFSIFVCVGGSGLYRTKTINACLVVCGNFLNNIDYFSICIMQNVLGGSLHKNNTSLIITLGTVLYHDSVNWTSIVLRTRRSFSNV